MKQALKSLLWRTHCQEAHLSLHYQVTVDCIMPYELEGNFLIFNLQKAGGGGENMLLFWGNKHSKSCSPGVSLNHAFSPFLLAYFSLFKWDHLSYTCPYILFWKHISCLILWHTWRGICLNMNCTLSLNHIRFRGYLKDTLDLDFKCGV